MNENGAAERWSFGRRLAFCFAFVYLVLYLFPFPLDLIPGIDGLLGPYYDLWSAIVHRAGPAFFGVNITVDPNGSGDTTYNYVQLFVSVVFSAIVALVWVIVDRRRANYARLHHWLRIYVRFGLAAAMLTYGAIKVIQSQFPPPGLGRLVQPFGDAAPMGLLWTFMGASRSYNFFTGAGEMLGGLLLTMRRTTLLGALISAAIMSNVAMLNFSYDVPVKLYSVHLLLMALFLAVPDADRLLRFFMLNRPADAAPLVDPFTRPRLRTATLIARTLFVIVLIVLPVQRAISSQKRYLDSRTPLQGIWRVEEFESNGKVIPPMLSEESRWRRVVFDPGEMDVQLVSDTRIRYRLKMERVNILALTQREDPSKKYRLTYTQPEPERIIVTGPIEGENVRAVLRKTPTPSFMLTSRGFHWISEYPYNR